VIALNLHATVPKLGLDSLWEVWRKVECEEMGSKTRDLRFEVGEPMRRQKIQEDALLRNALDAREFSLVGRRNEVAGEMGE
jgi:hypothetical protein